MEVEDEVIEAVKTTNTTAVSVVVGLVALGVGVGIGYILGKRKRDQFIHAVPAQKDWSEISAPDPDEYRSALVQTSESDDKAKEFIASRLGVSADELEVVVEEETDELDKVSIFEEPDDEWDPVTEQENRQEEIYVLRKDEYLADERGWPQYQATYYAGDDIMTDAEDQVIFNYKSVFGELMFGHGSQDPNVFYVRNEKMEAEYEIVRHSGHFSVEVAGLEIEDNVRETELRHSSRPRKFRMD